MTNYIINIQTRTDQEMLFNTKMTEVQYRKYSTNWLEKGQATNFFLMGGVDMDWELLESRNPNDQ